MSIDRSLNTGCRFDESKILLEPNRQQIENGISDQNIIRYSMPLLIAFLFPMQTLMEMN